MDLSALYQFGFLQFIGSQVIHGCLSTDGSLRDVGCLLQARLASEVRASRPQGLATSSSVNRWLLGSLIRTGWLFEEGSLSFFGGLIIEWLAL